MAVPTIRAWGTPVVASGADVTPVNPTHQEGDVLVAFVVTSRRNDTITCATSGWNEASPTDSPWRYGTPSDSVQLRIYEHFAMTSSEANPTFQGAADAIVAVVVSVAGPRSFNYINLIAGGTQGTTGSIQIPGGTTTVDDCIVFSIVASSADVSSTEEFDSWTNGDLSSFAEGLDFMTASGDGCGFGIAVGGKASAGSYGTTTATAVTTGAYAVFATLAIAGPGAVAGPAGVANCLLWLRADAIQGLVDGDNVAVWADQSGNGFNLTASSNHPKYFTNVINGRPVVRFDGVNDRMSRSDALGFTGNPAMTVFIVAKHDGGADTSQRILQMGESDATAGTVIALVLEATVGAAINFNNGNEVWGGVDADAWGVNAWKRPASQQHDAAQFYRDGVEETATGSTNPTNTTTLTNETFLLGRGDPAGGGSEFWDGDIAEVLVYSTALSDTDRATIEGYLRDRYFPSSYLPPRRGRLAYTRV